MSTSLRQLLGRGFAAALVLALPIRVRAQASDAFAVSVAPANPAVTVGNTLTFTTTLANASTGVTYQWSLNGVPIAGATAPTYTTPPVTLTSQGVYSVAATEGGVTTAIGASTLTASFQHDATFAFDSWSAATPLPTATTYTAVAFNGSDFLTVGFDGTAYSSPDGAAWSPSPSNGLGQTWGELNGVVAVPGGASFVAVGNGGAIVDYAGPGFSGQLASSGTTNLLTGVAAGNGVLVAVGYGGVSTHSKDGGLTWATVATGVSQNLNAVAYGDSQFVAVGLGGTVATSPDGVTWTLQSLGATTNLYGIAYGARGFVAVGDGGAVYTSPNGSLWLSEGSQSAEILVHVGYGAGVFVAEGLGGVVLTSTDEGVTWVPDASGTAQRLDGVAYGTNAFVLTGVGGTVVRSAAAVPSVLSNLSARAYVGTGADILIAGFIIKGEEPKEVLARGVGPALDQFGLVGLPTVDLTLDNVSGQTVGTNAGWGDSSFLLNLFAQVGAFALTPDSGDAALAIQLSAGAYTSQVSGAAGATGVALAEVYDADGSLTTKLANLSARANVGTGGDILIAGFVIAGNTPKTVLIRGIGPTLSNYGITSPLATPQLVLYDAANDALLSNTVWGGGSALSQAFTTVGAFALPAASVDSALLVTLPPGSYTAELSGTSGATGVGLAEVYDVP